MIFSYDIFDTTLVRTYLKSTDLFDGLASVLAKEKLIEEEASFKAERINAEVKARQITTEEEISLEEIYNQLSLVYQWTSKQCSLAKKLEIEFELKNLRPNAEIVEEINDLISKGNTVCFASDIYLKEDFINEALLKNGIRKGFDLFTSSAKQKTKHHSSLYSFILKHYDTSFHNIVHKGDNKYSDYEVPRKLGIRATWYKSSMPSLYEKMVYGLSFPDRKLIGRLAGSMKSARLGRSFSDERQKTIWETGANVIGPILFSYVLWVLQMARSKNIERLNFIARDGQILLKVAKIIQNYCPQFQSIQCHYLYGSRQAWHLPSVTKIEDSEISWIFDNTNFLSIESICQRVGIQIDSIGDTLLENGFDKGHWNDNLAQQQRIRLKNIFKSSIEIQSRIIEQADEKRKTLLGYLAQEEFFATNKVGIVDIGWRGRLQSSLSKSLIADSKTGVELHGFYWGLYSDSSQVEKNGVFHSFFKKPLEKRKTDFLTKYAQLLEVFVAATHGSCVGYSYSELDKKYAPHLKEQVNSTMIEWGIETQQQATLQFCKDFCSSISSEDIYNIQHESLLRINTILFTHFCKDPSFKEADTYGSVKIFEDQTENISYELAPRTSLENPAIKHNHNIWREGCRARNHFIFYYSYRVSTIIREINKRIFK
jgi:predicted HAD superfamily hydrolase